MDCIYGINDVGYDKLTAHERAINAAAERIQKSLDLNDTDALKVAEDAVSVYLFSMATQSGVGW